MTEAAPALPWQGRTLRLGVLVSGGGTNLQAILDARTQQATPVYNVSVVISNVAGVKALERAQRAGIATHVESHRSHSNRSAFERALIETLRSHDVDVVILAGFMRVLTQTFIDAFPHRIVNVHPALCPSFPGMHAAKQALDAGARITGCTVHLVDAGTDTGPILAQAAVPVLQEDDEDSLQARIQTQEHRLLPLVLTAMAQGQVRFDAQPIVVDGLLPQALGLSWKGAELERG